MWDNIRKAAGQPRRRGRKAKYVIEDDCSADDVNKVDACIERVKLQLQMVHVDRKNTTDREGKKA